MSRTHLALLWLLAFVAVALLALDFVSFTAVIFLMVCVLGLAALMAWRKW